MLYISRVRITNVRCFDSLDIRLNEPGGPAGWTVFVGDNATGKSTLLRSIALGLCDEASAAGLLKESDEGYIRRGQDTARITIDLHDPRAPKENLQIRTSITRRKGKSGIFSDRVRQTTIPARDIFPWDRIFISGYGAGRGVVGTGDIAGYSAIDAVYNMFNYSEGLQNPELVIRRIEQNPSTQKRLLQRRILGLLARFLGARAVRLTNKGVLIDGPWGDGMPFRDLADGYRSSFLWLVDLIGWAFAFRPRLSSPDGIRGVVLIDEIEQHLHAVWQRSVVDDLRRLLPNLQFVATTHSPLIASRLGQDSPDRSADTLYVLEAQDRKGVKAHRHEFMRGWRMDQVLAARAFKYLIDDDPAIENMLREASALASIKKRTSEEEARYRQLSIALQPILLSDGQTLFERDLELSQYHTMRKRIRDVHKRLSERGERDS